MPLPRVEVRKKPTLACLGFVKAVGEPKTNEKGTISVPIDIEALEQGQGRKYFFSYTHEMLNGSFDPAEASSGDEFLYRKNLAVDDPENFDEGDVSALKAMTGDSYDNVADRLIAVNGQGAEGVAEVLRDSLLDLADQGLRFGYVLRQQYDKTGEVDDAGKAVKKATKWYEVGSFYIPSERVIERLVKRSKKAKADKPFLITFET